MFGCHFVNLTVVDEKHRSRRREVPWKVYAAVAIP